MVILYFLFWSILLDANIIFIDSGSISVGIGGRNLFKIVSRLHVGVQIGQVRKYIPGPTLLLIDLTIIVIIVIRFLLFSQYSVSIASHSFLFLSTSSSQKKFLIRV